MNAILKQKAGNIFGFVIILFFFSVLICKQILYKGNEFSNFYQLFQNAKQISAVFNNPIFWNLSFGISLKVAIDIFVVSILLKMAFVILSQKQSWSTAIKISAIAEMVFLLQFLIEFFYIELIVGGNNYKEFRNISLLSVDYFYRLSVNHYPLFLSYTFHLLGVFELLYWLVLALLIKAFLNISFTKSVYIVLLGYIAPLAIWLLFLSWQFLIQ